MFKIWKRKELQESRSENLVSIVANAAIASGSVGDGRLLPLVILDTTARPDLVDLFKAHESFPPGDAISTWVSLENSRDDLALWLQFKKPIETEAIIKFDLDADGLTADLAMRGKAIYLQAGKPGDRLYREMEAPRILVELGTEMPTAQWETIWKKAIRKRLRSMGATRTESKQLTQDAFDQMRASVEGIDLCQMAFTFCLIPRVPQRNC